MKRISNMYRNPKTVKRNGGIANSVVKIPASTVLYNHAKANLPLNTKKKEKC